MYKHQEIYNRNNNLRCSRRIELNESSSAPTEVSNAYSLPCFSMIATGSCSYEDCCKFLHDHRLRCPNHDLISNCRLPPSRKTHTQSITSCRGYALFYWPQMKSNFQLGSDNIQDSLIATRASLNLSSPNSLYEVKVDKRDKAMEYKTTLLSSMWSHFLENISKDKQNCKPLSVLRDESFLNPITQRPRLPIFRELSQRSKTKIRRKVTFSEPLAYSKLYERNSSDIIYSIEESNTMHQCVIHTLSSA